MLKKAASYLGAYSLWIVILLLGAWCGYLSQRALLGLAVKYYLNDEFMRQTLIRALDRWYVFLIGLVWLVLMVATEELFRQAARKGNIFRLFAAFAGFILLFIFIFDLILFALTGWYPDPLRIAILLVELFLCSGLIAFWIKIKKKKV